MGSSNISDLPAAGSFDLDLDLDPELLDLLADPAPPASGPQQSFSNSAHSPAVAGPWVGVTGHPAHGHTPPVVVPPTMMMAGMQYPNPAWMTPFVIPNRGLGPPAVDAAHQQHQQQMAMAMGCWSGASELVMGAEAVGEKGGCASAAGGTETSTSVGKEEVENEEEKGSSGNGGADKRTAALLKRQAAIQAKNRRAQKRFRERQKAKMANLEVQVEDLCSEVEALKAENSSLSNQNKLMSKVLQLKDQQMCVLQESVKVLERGSRQEGKLQSNPEMPGPLPAPDSDAGDMVLCKNPGPCERVAQVLPTSKFLNITPQELKDLWKQYVLQLSGLMIQAGDSNSQSTVEEELPKLLQEMGEICCKSATLCPASMKQLLVGSCEAPDGQKPPEDQKLKSLWSDVLEILGVSPEQTTKMFELRRTFLARMKTLWQHRSVLNKRFQDCIDLVGGQVYPGTQITCEISLKLSEIVDELRDSLHRETQYHYDFINTFFEEVLDDMQIARVFVHSYPYYPDILAITNLCIEKDGQQMEG